MSDNDRSDYVTIGYFCDRLRISRVKALRWLREGRLPRPTLAITNAAKLWRLSDATEFFRSNSVA